MHTAIVAQFCNYSFYLSRLYTNLHDSYVCWGVVPCSRSGTRPHRRAQTTGPDDTRPLCLWEAKSANEPVSYSLGSPVSVCVAAVTVGQFTACLLNATCTCAAAVQVCWCRGRITVLHPALFIALQFLSAWWTLFLTNQLKCNIYFSKIVILISTIITKQKAKACWFSTTAKMRC